MQITIWEIADCWTESEILQYRKQLLEQIKVFDEAMKIKITRLQNTLINIPNTDRGLTS